MNAEECEQRIIEYKSNYDHLLIEERRAWSERMDQYRSEVSKVYGGYREMVESLRAMVPRANNKRKTIETELVRKIIWGEP